MKPGTEYANEEGGGVCVSHTVLRAHTHMSSASAAYRPFTLHVEILQQQSAPSLSLTNVGPSKALIPDTFQE